MIKRKVVIFLMLTLLATCIAGSSDAQFWKRKSKRHHSKTGDQNKEAADSTQTKPNRHERKKEKKKEKKEHKREKKEHKKQKRELKHERKEKKRNLAKAKRHPGSVAAVPPLIIKKQEIHYPATQMKKKYRVDVLAPLYLDDFAKNGSTSYSDRIPDKAMPGIAFYEGLNIAADSLKKAGFSFDIYVHDVASAAESANRLVTSGMLDSADLIIGAVQPQDIPGVAAFAKKKQVNFVSAMSQTDAGVKDNEYFTLLQPTLKTHCHRLVIDIQKRFPGAKVTLLCRTSVPVDEMAYNYLINDTSVKVDFKPLLCNSLPGTSAITGLSDTITNVVAIAVLDPKYADSLLKMLSYNFPALHFEVYGMPAWSGINDLRKEGVFRNLNVSYTVPFNIDESVGMGKYVSRTYKDDYGGKPSEMAFRGFEAMFWYANLLKHYGMIFNLKYDDNSSAPFTKFDIKPQWDKDGNFLFYENMHVFLSRYEGGFPRTE